MDVIYSAVSGPCGCDEEPRWMEEEKELLLHGISQALLPRLVEGMG